MITSTTIEFRYLPVQHGPPAIREFLDAESEIIEAEIKKLLHKGVIVRTDRETPGNTDILLFSVILQGRT